MIDIKLLDIVFKFHMSIKILSERTINRIAAGEIIERPVAVVKELVENALDAGSSKISITLVDGGFTNITIIDDGVGIERQELALAIERHATSKLYEEDIHNITYMGFRGEALPSIGSVSHMTVTSRTAHADSAWSISVHDGAKGEVKPAARATTGTTVEVCNLFANMPVKLKFAKTARSEEMACLDLIERMALVYPQSSFQLSNGSKTLLRYDVDMQPQDIKTLDARITKILGQEFYQNSRDFHVTLQDITIHGRAGLPTYNASNGLQQYIYVNKRIVKDKFLMQCVRNSYRGLLADNRYPVVLLFIEIEPHAVDVNVHPNKAEVRFRDEPMMRELLYKTLRNTVRYIQGADDTQSQGPVIQPVSRVEADRSINIANRNTPGSGLSYQYTNIHLPREGSNLRAAVGLSSPPAYVQPLQATQLHLGEPMAPSSGALGQAICQVDDTYIIAQTQQGLIIVDQHAAHERMTLEKMKQAVVYDKLSIQYLLVPVVVELGVSLTELLLEHKAKLQELGLVVERNGTTQIIVRGIPMHLGQEDVTTLVRDVVGRINECGELDEIWAKCEDSLGNIACHRSIRAGQKLSVAQMNALLREMEQTGFAGQCNHGRPTFVSLTSDALAKMFERK